jgi:hypothetical protein
MQKNHLIVTTLDVGDQKLARLGLKNWPFKKKDVRSSQTNSSREKWKSAKKIK